MLDALGNLIDMVLGLGLDAGSLSVGQMAARAVVTFIATVAIIRLGDKRLFGKGTAFDIVVAIMIGSVMSRGITGSAPLVPAWIAGLVLILMHWLLASLAYHVSWFGPLVKGSPVLLIEDGQLRKDGMREGSITRNDLAQALRMDGTPPDISRVQRAYLERDGSISVLTRQREPRILEVAVEDGVQTVRLVVG